MCEKHYFLGLAEIPVTLPSNRIGYYESTLEDRCHMAFKPRRQREVGEPQNVLASREGRDLATAINYGRGHMNLAPGCTCHWGCTQVWCPFCWANLKDAIRQQFR